VLIQELIELGYDKYLYADKIARAEIASFDQEIR